MSQLQQLLEQLHKPDASELVIATGRPVTLRQAGKYKNLSNSPVSEQQLSWLVRDTALAPLVADTGVGAQQSVAVLGYTVRVQVIHHGGEVMLRLERDPNSRHQPVFTRPATEPSVTFASAKSAPAGATFPRPSTPEPVPTFPRAPGPDANLRSAEAVPTFPRSPEPEPTFPRSPAPRAAAPGPAVSAPIDHPVEPPRALAALVTSARDRGATDLHIAAGRPVAGRILGELHALEATPRAAADVEALLLPLLDGAQRAQLDTRGYVDFAVEVSGAGRLRVNVSRQQGGLKGSFRLAHARPPTLADLGLPAELAKLTHNHQGLIVIAGPSGHGKTTTLAALVDLVNSTEAVHILMIEDPVEILHPRKTAVVSQREVGRHTASFAAALKASLREDPDVIVIGELRDRETVEIAMTAAETGHLVIATMSTPSASKTIDRLIDMFPPDEQSQVRSSLAGALRAVVAQRLVPAADGKSLTPAVEIVVGVLPLATLIRENKLFQLPSLMQRGRGMGMRRLDDSLLELVRAGQITEETALATAESRKDLQHALHPDTRAAAAAPQPTSRLQKLGGFFGRKGTEGE